MSDGYTIADLEQWREDNRKAWDDTFRQRELNFIEQLGPDVYFHMLGGPDSIEGGSVSGHELYYDDSNPTRGFDEFEVFSDEPAHVSVCAAHIQVNLEREDVVRLRDQLNEWLATPIVI